MRLRSSVTPVLCLLICAGHARCQAAFAGAATSAAGWSSSSSTVEPNGTVEAAPLPAAPTAVTLGEAPLHASVLAGQPEALHRGVRPFSALAVQVKGGFEGFGLDVATPLAKRFNLRAGGSFYSYDGSYNADGITINGEVKFRSGTLSLDCFPFNNSFRISGAMVYNGNNVNALAFVPAGGQFDLGDDTYISSASDPVHGNASLTFGRHIAPSVTIGFGNMIPRSGRHFSAPFEIGVVFLGTPPQIKFGLQGTACDGSGNCGDIATDPTTQMNLQQEELEINSDITGLRFYPIISQGISYRF